MAPPTPQDTSSFLVYLPHEEMWFESKLSWQGVQIVSRIPYCLALFNNVILTFFLALFSFEKDIAFPFIKNKIDNDTLHLFAKVTQFEAQIYVN
jgi:hypothetical protein